MEQGRINLYAGLMAVPLAIILGIVIHVPIDWGKVVEYMIPIVVLAVIVVSSLISPPQQSTRRSAHEREKGEVTPFK
jgi:hypothetical protein